MKPATILVPVVALLCSARLEADAIIRTQAMLATTIAEYYVEDERVRVELEIGLADLEAFRNLMPDGIYARMGHEPRPLAERAQSFFRDEFLIFADAAQLPGRVLTMGPKERIRRDEITGEPLPAAEAEAETVVVAQLEFPFTDRPGSLTFAARWSGRGPNVGFVVYHKNIAVNDFRYLTPSQTLDLDWDDPWYSSFRTRNLRRSYFSPMSGFIYVEPYEVRKEIIVRPKDLQHWIDLGLEGRETIPVEMQNELKRTVADFLRERHKVVIDGEEITPDLARINFLERTLRTSRVIDPPVELDANSAILGAIFVYPTVEPLPQQVTMDWDLFTERIQLVPAASVDQAGALPTYLEPDYAVLEWRNFLKNPELPTLTAITPPPTTFARTLLYLRWLMLVVTLAALWWGLRQARDRNTEYAVPLLAVAMAVLVTAGSFWLSREAELSDEKAKGVVSGLLHNIYRAFDFRQEEDIYDVLDKSVTGDLLTQIYLETRRGLELANQGGARAKVKEIELVELAAQPEGGGFIATATWNVMGSVGHWGHVHTRQNQYQAELDIQPILGVWKLTNLQILQEERL